MSTRLRPEVGLVAVLIAVLSASWSLQWLLAVVVHEIGHGVFGAALSRRSLRLDVQLGAADAYLRPEDPPSVRWTITICGLMASVAWLAVVRASGFDPSAAVAWTIYQAFPFPASDGGVMLRDYWVRHGFGPSTAFRRCYLLSAGLALVLLAVLWSVDAMYPFAVGLGLFVGALVVAETEWPALIHVEAYRAWDEGHPEEVLWWVERLRRGGPRFGANVRELAVRAAMQLGRSEAVRLHGHLLPVEHGTRLDAAEWLLRRDDAQGAAWSEEALDDFTRLPSRWDADRRERLRELLVRFALFESRQGRPESAAGLIERACGLGPIGFDWLEYEPGGPALLRHPRVERLLN